MCTENINVSRMKNIEIIRASSYPFREFEEFEVRLDLLSKPAEALVKGILTTDNRDDLSSVTAICPLTNLEEAKLLNIDDHYIEGDDFYMPPIPPEKRMHIYHPYDANSYGYAEWRFDAIKKHETPEQYFERHIREMKRKGYTSFETRWPEFTVFSLYENENDQEEAVESYRKTCIVLGEIVGQMKAQGANYNKRSFFLQDVFQRINPLQPISENEKELFRQLAGKYIRMRY